MKTNNIKIWVVMAVGLSSVAFAHASETVSAYSQGSFAVPDTREPGEAKVLYDLSSSQEMRQPGEQPSPTTAIQNLRVDTIKRAYPQTSKLVDDLLKSSLHGDYARHLRMIWLSLPFYFFDLESKQTIQIRQIEGVLVGKYVADLGIVMLQPFKSLDQSGQVGAIVRELILRSLGGSAQQLPAGVLERATQAFLYQMPIPQAIVDAAAKNLETQSQNSIDLRFQQDLRQCQSTGQCQDAWKKLPALYKNIFTAP